MSQEFVLREVDISQDAEKLAEMWRASDNQWPGTWSGGAEITPQWVAEWYRREKMINTWAFETEGKIVAYCSFNEREEEKNVGYVDLLNVQPEYQKLSLGRRLLQKCLERCKELGFHLLTLGTWPGNLKSVPLYKKTGFFWVPDTSVWMLNFIPTILNLPCAQPYFSQHDWYRTFRRKLEQVEDIETWEDMKVFVYHWEEDGHALTAWADREAHTLTAVETDAFLAGAIAENIEPAKGLSTHIRWRLMNKQDRPMAVSLIASGNEHIRLDHRATFSVAPGETTEIRAAVDIAADTPEVQHHKPVPAVRTLLIIDGEVLELGTGLRPQPAVAVTTSPGHVTLVPGVAKTVYLQLRSHLKRDAEATLSLAPAPGLTIDQTEHKVSIPAKSFAAVPIKLCAAHSGVYPLHATVYLGDGKTLPERLPVFCLPAGGVLADQGAKQTRIENEWTRLVIRPRSGEVFIDSVQDNMGLGGFRESIGPPFWPCELDDKDLQITLEQADGRITATATADLDTYPGLRLCRKISLGGGPLAEIEYALANTGTVSHQVQLQPSVRHWHNNNATLTVPLAGGIVQSPRSELPAAPEDLDRKPEALAERWTALTSTWGTVGAIWEDSVVENDIRGVVELLTPQFTVAPQQWMPAGKLYVYAGPGDWQVVRKYARRIAGMDSVPEPISVGTRKVFDARLEPRPLVTVDDEFRSTFVVDNLRARPLKGQARLVLPPGLQVDRDSFELEGISRDHSLAEQVTLRLAPAATAYQGQVCLSTQLSDEYLQVPVIRLGDRGTVAIAQAEREGQSTYTLDNGRTRFSIAPGFSGALIGWEEDGFNHVISPFPQHKTFGWMSPWYGGLTPMVLKEGNEELPGHFYQETITAETVAAPDERGLPWTGIRLEGDITREELVGLRIEVEYLTVGHSNVLKLVQRVHNATTAKRRVVVGWLSYWQPDGESQANVLRSPTIERKHVPWMSWSQAGHWSMVTNGNTGRTAALISPYPHVWAMDWGDASSHMGWWAGIDVMPSSCTERVCYVALCQNLDEAKRYTQLQACL